MNPSLSSNMKIPSHMSDIISEEADIAEIILLCPESTSIF